MIARIDRKDRFALILGGGDIASGVALRLHRSGVRVLVTELPRPTAIRRLVSFAEAVYSESVQVEEITGRKIDKLEMIVDTWEKNEIPVFVDENASCVHELHPLVLIDGRMTKRPPAYKLDIAQLVIGLGPGFTAGENCHAVIETNRGHQLGRVNWEGTAEADTGIPEAVLRHQKDRVLRAPAVGVFTSVKKLGQQVKEGQVIAKVSEFEIRAPFDGVIRGLLHDGIEVKAGFKVGDIDPRNNPSYVRLVSDKSLSVAGGVLEAILSKTEVRSELWQ